jgi:hypothetical protein
LNFFELRTFKHIKTVPLMDELEGVIVLNAKHSAALLNQPKSAAKKTGTSEHVLVTAGGKGVLRILRVSMTVRLYTPLHCTVLCVQNPLCVD